MRGWGLPRSPLRTSGGLLAVAAVAVALATSCAGSDDFGKVAARGVRNSTPPIHPPPSASSAPTSPAAPSTAAVPPTTVAPPPPPVTVAPPAPAATAPVPRQCRYVSATAVADVVGATDPPLQTEIAPTWCRYSFDAIGNDTVDVTLFYGSRGDNGQGTPVAGLGHPAWWDSDSKTLVVQLSNGLVWIAVELSPEIRGRQDPEDVAIAIYRKAAPRLP